MLKTTMSTLKLLTTAKRLPLSGVDVSAARASLRRVSGWNKNYWNTRNYGFVLREHPKLVERPVICSTPFGSVPRLFVEALPNVGQVLKSQCSINLFCFFYQLTADSVIQPLLKALFSAGEPSQQSSRTASAFALNIASDLGIAVTSGLNLCTTPAFICAGRGDISASQIHSDYLGRFARWVGWNLNADIDVIVSFPGFIQGCRRWDLTPKQRDLVITNREFELFPSCNQGDSNGLQILQIDEGANVKVQRSRTKLVDLFNGFSIANHATNRLTDVVCLQTCRFSDWLVNQVMQLGCVPLFVLFSDSENLIASISKTLKCQVNFLTKLLRDLKLTFNRYNLHLNTLKTHA